MSDHECLSKWPQKYLINSGCLLLAIDYLKSGEFDGASEPVLLHNYFLPMPLNINKRKVLYSTISSLPYVHINLWR